MSDVLEYIVVGGLHALVIGELNIFMRDILEYIEVGGASRPGYRRVTYFYERYFRIY
jgi:hypothetical protein